MNTREQGDIGELSAMQWLADQGAKVFVPIGHSPDVDIVALLDGRLVGIQCKTTTWRNPNGKYVAAVATRGGNQSWSGLVKRFDAARCDYLFVLAGDGRRWFIPSVAVAATSAITMDCPKYEEFEIERGRPILTAVA